VIRVVVDRKVLDGFKRRAMRAFPNEYIEEVWGRLRKGEAHVFAISTIKQIDATPNEVEAELSAECGEREKNLTLLGTIHTHIHPDPAEPSRIDLINFREEGELIMGIMSVKKTGKRRFSTTAFYSGNKKLELLVAEG
jgi:proteasome lid subunit RPN8/RPN11